MKPIPYPHWLASALQGVEQIVDERLQERQAVLSVIGPGVLSAHNGRLRATLVLLSCAIGDYKVERVLHAAAAVELIHAAALTHAALISSREQERSLAEGEAWDHGVTLMVGDYLYALAAAEMALAPDARVIGYYSQAVMRITEAALAPVTRLLPTEEALAEFYSLAEGRSAALMSAACKAGAASGNLADEQIDALGRYGYQCGLADAIAAEIAAFETDDDRAKLRGISLPLIYAAAHSDAPRLAAAFGAASADDAAWAIEQIRQFGIPRTHEALLRAREAARTSLAAFPPSEARTVLEMIAARERKT
jgi:geranylgeranyl pyrophosphate synthase